jgi:sec-independent protein translocase protein TatA
MGDVGLPELIVVLVVVLVIFGPGKIPEVGAALGRGLRDFREALGGSAEQAETASGQAKRKPG